MTTKMDLWYAKLVFRMDTEKRMATARKLASLLRNDFTLMDALGRLESIESYGGKKPNEPFAIERAICNCYARMAKESGTRNEFF